MVRLASVAFACALVGCASTPRQALAPLPQGREVAVSYGAELGPAQSYKIPGDSTPCEPARFPVDLASGEPSIRVHCRLRELHARNLARLLGDEHASNIARIAKRDEVERTLAPWLESGVLRPGPQQWITLHSGLPGYVWVHEDTAFVEAFEIVQHGDAFIGDPRVAVARQGCTLDVRAVLASAPGPIGVDVGVNVSELLRPLLERAVRLPGTSEFVSLEVPLHFSQVLKAKATLAADEVLILGTLVADDPNRRIVAFVEALEEPRDAKDATRKIASNR